MGFSYNDGIHKAESEGRITGSDFRTPDVHTHLSDEDGAVGYCNAREIDDGASCIASFLKPDAKILVLGGGIGRESYQLHQLQPKAAIDLVSLRPCNPYAAMTQSASQLHGEVERLLGTNTLQQLKQETLLGKTLDRASAAELAYVPMSTIEKLQNEGRLSAFQLLESPYIRQQFIGKFPEELMPKDQYDFIFEQEGPIAKGRKGIEPYPLALAKAVSLLSPSGILYIAARCSVFDSVAFAEELDKKGTAEYLFIHETEQNNGQAGKTLIVAKQSPLYSSMIERFGKYRINKGASPVIELPNWDDCVERLQSFRKEKCES
jgi:hypothetical protein